MQEIITILLFWLGIFGVCMWGGSAFVADSLRDVVLPSKIALVVGVVFLFLSFIIALF